MKLDVKFGDIVCIDMDKTLCNEVCFTPQECLDATPQEWVIETVAEAYKTGFIVIYTARVDELIPATLEWLRRNNVRYHAISNLKIPAAIYLDDKAVRV